MMVSLFLSMNLKILEYEYMILIIICLWYLTMLKKQPNDAIYLIVLWMIILNLVICIKINIIFIILNQTRILIMIK